MTTQSMKEDNEMPNKDKIGFSTLAIMEIQMKITMRHPYTLIKMTIKMIGSIVLEDVEQLELIYSK